MRLAAVLWVAVVWGSPALAQETKPAKRYDVLPLPERYPQLTPKDTLASVIQALDDKRIDYLLAHLADPAFVDRRVKDYGGRFEELIQETTGKLAGDPSAVKDLRRFLKEGEWEDGETTATVKLKDVKDRQVFLRKIGNRWFLENRMKPAPDKK